LFVGATPPKQLTPDLVAPGALEEQFAGALSMGDEQVTYHRMPEHARTWVEIGPTAAVEPTTCREQSKRV